MAARWRGTAAGILSFGELAEQSVITCRDLGFTHIELLPVHEHPFDGSWAISRPAFYAPTSRFGTPEDFRAFVDRRTRPGWA